MFDQLFNIEIVLSSGVIRTLESVNSDGVALFEANWADEVVGFRVNARFHGLCNGSKVIGLFKEIALITINEIPLSTSYPIFNMTIDSFIEADDVLSRLSKNGINRVKDFFEHDKETVAKVLGSNLQYEFILKTITNNHLGVE